MILVYSYDARNILSLCAMHDNVVLMIRDGSMQNIPRFDETHALVLNHISIGTKHLHQPSLSLMVRSSQSYIFATRNKPEEFDKVPICSHVSRPWLQEYEHQCM